MSAPITWAQASSPILWSNIGINWNTPAQTGASTFSLGNTYNIIHDFIAAESISFATSLGKVHASTAAFANAISFGFQGAMPSGVSHTLVNSLSLGLSTGYTSSGVFSAAESITVPLTVTYVNATNHQESISIGSTMDIPRSGTFAEFLWSGVTDPSTSWAAVTDPTSTWSSVSDSSTTWTKVDYPN